MNHKHNLKRVNLTIVDVGERKTIYRGDDDEFYEDVRTPINKPMHIVFEFCSECDFATINGASIKKGAIPDLNMFTYIDKPFSVIQWLMQHLEFEVLKQDIKKAIDKAKENEVIS